MTHWARKLGLAAVVALALGAAAPATADAAPSFCRSGAGHPRFGREWCIRKGFGLGGGFYRYGRPSWSYSPYYRSNDWYPQRWSSWDRARYPRYDSYVSPRDSHLHDRRCRH